MIKKAALIKNGKIENIIIVDTDSNFDYSSLGYVLLDQQDAGVGWIEQEDGTFDVSRPSTPEEPVNTSEPPIPKEELADVK